MGRDKLYPNDYTLDIRSNAEDLVRRVNNLLNALQIKDPKLSSGWRPSAINSRSGGAKRSLHMFGKAVDLVDKDGSIKDTILKCPEKLLEYGLWLEDPASTPSWCHLDTGIRSTRAVRVFKP